ncbi:hypothetical protein K438DRAFT_2026235 [Mycena galopus ATCC 62051]|nr:hypothetical protein K438DRAFT_2026235 [Mycena galopus ATCC 62051]
MNPLSLIRKPLPSYAIRDNEAQSASSKEIREYRNRINPACTHCMGRGELRRCGKCKGAWYCSKECQKKHWPKHKEWCSEVDGSGIQKLVINAYSNPVFNSILQTLFVLHFDLLRFPRVDKPFMARRNRYRKMDGMVQMNSFWPLTPGEVATITPGKYQVWREARDSVDTKETPDWSVGLVEIANGENRQTFTLPVIIGSPILSLVKEGAPWKMVYPDNGEVIKSLMTIHSSMEFLNEHIRADVNNQLLLRTEMRPSDIKQAHPGCKGGFG